MGLSSQRSSDCTDWKIHSHGSVKRAFNYGCPDLISIPEIGQKSSNKRVLGLYPPASKFCKISTLLQ